MATVVRVGGRLLRGRILAYMVLFGVFLTCLVAELPKQCDNGRMRTLQLFTISLLLAGAAIPGSARTNQAATAKNSPAQASSGSRQSAAKPAASSANGSPATEPLPTQREKASYALGMNIAKGLKGQGVDADPGLVARGLKDEMAGGKTLLTDAEAVAALNALQAEMRKKQDEQKQLAGETNMKEGEAFLAANKAKEGVVTLPSGLQYKILTAGTGLKPAAGDTVICNYRGTFINGAEFDSSYKRGQPASFPVGQVIKGWTEALQLMPVGSKWQLVIPPSLAYGAQGAGGVIGPNATLIFEVELIGIRGKTP